MVVFVVFVVMVVVTSGAAAYFMPGPEDSDPQETLFFSDKARELRDLERRVCELERRIKELYYL